MGTLLDSTPNGGSFLLTDKALELLTALHLAGHTREGTVCVLNHEGAEQRTVEVGVVENLGADLVGPYHRLVERERVVVKHQLWWCMYVLRV